MCVYIHTHTPAGTSTRQCTNAHVCACLNQHKPQWLMCTRFACQLNTPVPTAGWSGWDQVFTCKLHNSKHFYNTRQCRKPVSLWYIHLVLGQYWPVIGKHVHCQAKTPRHVEVNCQPPATVRSTANLPPRSRCCHPPLRLCASIAGTYISLYYM